MENEKTISEMTADELMVEMIRLRAAGEVDAEGYDRLYGVYCGKRKAESEKLRQAAV